MKNAGFEDVLFHNVETPIGTISCGASEFGIHKVGFESALKIVEPNSAKIRTLFESFEKQIKEYFAGSRQEFDLPLQIEGTDFQQRVWRCMRSIRYGQSMTYGEIAKTLGQKGSARAVGGAANSNNLPILIPCHRVVGANKKLTGFAGGMEKKVFLLNMEGGNWSLDENIK